MGFRYTGAARPPLARAPAPGQESVWDYPRPPRCEPDARLIEVRLRGELVASTTLAIRVLETGGAPCFYVPARDVNLDLLVSAPGATVCEWKGEARYFDVVAEGARAARAAWSYPAPSPGYEAIAGAYAFYPGLLDCTVGRELARPQPGSFYGGWVTAEIVGPLEGEPGTERW